MESKRKTAFSELSHLNWTFVLPAVLLLPSIVWLVLDHHIWPWDQALYGQDSIRLWYDLTHHLWQWPRALFDLYRPPLIAWLGQFFVPLGQLSGSIDFGLAILILAAQYVTLALAYSIGKELGNGRAAVAFCACLAMASAPLFVGLSTQFFVEPLQLLAVTYTFWLALKCRSMKPLDASGHLMLAFALVLLSKASTALYCFMPGLLATVTTLRSLKLSCKNGALVQRKTDLFFPSLTTTLAVISIAWYMHNFQAVCATVRDASCGAAALNYGHKDTFLHKFGLWLGGVEDCLSVPQFDTALLGALGLYSGVQLSRHRFGGAALCLSYPGCFAAVAAAQFLVALTVLSLSIGEDRRYILAALPPLAVLLSAYLSALRSAFMPYVCAVLLSLQLLIVQATALGLLKSFPGIGGGYLCQPQSEFAKESELKRLVQFFTVDSPDQAVVVGVSCSWFNANTLNYYAGKRQLESNRSCLFIGLPILSGKQMDVAREIFQSSKASSFVTLVPGRVAPDFLNELSLPLWQMANQDDRFRRIPFKTANGIAIFSIRSEPCTRF